MSAPYTLSWLLLLLLDAGIGSSRTGLNLEDTSRTKFCGLGLGLGLDHVVLEHIRDLMCVYMYVL